MSESPVSLIDLSPDLTKARALFKGASGWTDKAIGEMPDFVRQSMINSAKDIINLLREGQ